MFRRPQRILLDHSLLLEAYRLLPCQALLDSCYSTNVAQL